MYPPALCFYSLS